MDAQRATHPTRLVRQYTELQRHALEKLINQLRFIYIRYFPIVLVSVRIVAGLATFATRRLSRVSLLCCVARCASMMYCGVWHQALARKDLGTGGESPPPNRDLALAKYRRRARRILGNQCHNKHVLFILFTHTASPKQKYHVHLVP